MMVLDLVFLCCYKAIIINKIVTRTLQSVLLQKESHIARDGGSVSRIHSLETCKKIGIKRTSTTTGPVTRLLRKLGRGTEGRM
jgi:hypothetical protein